MLQMQIVMNPVQVILEEGIGVATTGAGSPKKYMPIFKEAGIKVIPVIASVKHAIKMEAAGADAVIAEGQEAGGHRPDFIIIFVAPGCRCRYIQFWGRWWSQGRLFGCRDVCIRSARHTSRYLIPVRGRMPDLTYRQFLLDANDTATIVTGRKAKEPVRSLRNSMLEQYAARRSERTP